MDCADIDGITLEYEVQGSGEPVVFIHGALMGDTYRPLMAESALKDRKFIGYHRRGYDGSSPPDGPLTVAGHAADCLGLLRKLNAVPAHVVGHSSGGAIALQLALDAPEAVLSLAVLEPALLDVPSGAALFELLGPSAQIHEAGDKAGAVDRFLRAVCGKDYRRVVETQLPGALDQAAADADAFFTNEFPAVGGWALTQGSHPGGRSAHQAAGSFRRWGEHRRRYRPAHLQRDPRASARVVPEGKAVRPASRRPPATGREPARHGGGSGGLPQKQLTHREESK